MYYGHVLASWSNPIPRNVMSTYCIRLHLSLASGFEMPGKQFPLIWRRRSRQHTKHPAPLHVEVMGLPPTVPTQQKMQTMSNTTLNPPWSWEKHHQQHPHLQLQRHHNNNNNNNNNNNQNSNHNENNKNNDNKDNVATLFLSSSQPVPNIPVLSFFIFIFQHRCQALGPSIFMARCMNQAIQASKIGTFSGIWHQMPWDTSHSNFPLLIFQNWGSTSCRPCVQHYQHYLYF